MLNFKKLINFFFNSLNELKNVTWPYHKDVFYTTLLIIFITIIVSTCIWILDSMIIYIITYLNKIKF